MKQRVLAVLAGADMSIELLRKWARDADVVAAADSGADLLLAAQVRPQIVVGDMDAVSEEALATAEQVIRIVDDETTDCDKLLAYLEEQGHEEITLACVEGDLLDHALASTQSALRSNITVRLALRRGIAWILKPSSPVRVPAGRTGRVSLLPLTAVEGASLSGVAWPLDGVKLSPDGRLSISNKAVGAEIEARVEGGAALLFVEYLPDEVPIW
jgi:thiamine pyrophosphokinase